MKNLIAEYKKLSFEGKTLVKTVISMCFTAIAAAIKFIIGLLQDYDLCSIAIYNFLLISAKLQCVLGVRSKKISLKRRTATTAAFILISAVIYIGYMVKSLFTEQQSATYALNQILILATVSFTEFGLAVAGLIKTKDKGLYVKNIKIINFGTALMAILTTQTALLAYNSAGGDYNAYTGIAIGVFLALSAIYVLLSPKLSVSGRERNVFILSDKDKNDLIKTDGKVLITLCNSKLYGAYTYEAELKKNVLDGKIVRRPAILGSIPLLLKAICLILSEILIFVWLFGRIIYFFRTANLPYRLTSKLKSHGFELCFTGGLKIQK